MPIEEKKAMTLFLGAIALVLLCVGIAGLDYSETRERASEVPLHAQRIKAIETTMQEATREQTAATRELSRAVYELREVVAEMRGRSQ
jgi:methyl-accepting chemotaxis protein